MAQQIKNVSIILPSTEPFMKRLLALALFVVAGTCAAQVNVTPIVSPHQTFFDTTGLPCSLCSLHSYLAGTTTPTPTYTDSTGTSQNTNPIVLDLAGSANIWVGTQLSYKFVLINALGTTVFSIDNVKSSGGGVLPCSTPFAIQYSNSAATALACDPSITINPSQHSIDVGGPISGPFFTLSNLSAIVNSWTFDVSTPSTALSSLGLIPLTGLANQPADTALVNATAAAAPPTAVSLPTGCTGGINYSTVTHSFTCITAGTFPLSGLATQASDTVVMNATGSTATPTAVPMPATCTNGVNYSTTTHAWTCTAAGAVQTNVTGARAFGTSYQNTTGYPLEVAVFCNGSGASGGAKLNFYDGAATATEQMLQTANNNNGVTLIKIVPPSWYYEATCASNGGSPTLDLTNWIETTLQ